MVEALSDDWSSYWANPSGPAGGVHSCLTSEGPATVLTAYWQSVFQPKPRRLTSVRLLDIACGAGVVAAQAMEAFEGGSGVNVELHCTDYAHDAVKLAAAGRDRTGIFGTTADARQLPYRDHTFELVVSQFGLEYVGPEGFREAARLLAPDGELHLVIHRRDGAIYSDCLANLNTLRAFERVGLLALSRRTLRLAEIHDHDRNVSTALARATRSVHRARRVMENRMSTCAAGMARSHVERLLQDIPMLLVRRAAYGPGVAVGWIDAQQAELRAFSKRMAAMLAAAMDDEEIRAAANLLRGVGLTAVSVGHLRAGKAALPIGWTLSATAA